MQNTGEPIIDIHQHTQYSGRSDGELIAHQRTMGISQTVLLPAGSKYGLAVDAGGNDTVVGLAKQYSIPMISSSSPTSCRIFRKRGPCSRSI